jgi:glycosyltransferase involved in cell wall biosynthesis
VGTFGRTYDLDTVVEAARKLGRELRGPAQIVLSGAGDSLDRLRVQARDLPGVVFTGWLDATEVACMAQMADVGLMAYAAGAPQGLPNKLFEYLSAGIPILSSLRGETAELLAVHGCGHTYPASDADGLADALRAMLGSRRQREDMGRCGARLFDQRYSADAVYRDMAAFLERFAPKMQTAVAA